MKILFPISVNKSSKNNDPHRYLNGSYLYTKCRAFEEDNRREGSIQNSLPLKNKKLVSLIMAMKEMFLATEKLINIYSSVV